MDERRLASRTLIVALVAFSLTGAWISGEMVKRHADLWSSGSAGGGLFERFCRATESIGWNCTAAHQSRWSEVAVPLPFPSRDLSVHVRRVVVPVAFLGLAYFVFLATWFVFVGRPHPAGGSWQGIPLMVAWLGAAVSVLYLAAMIMGRAPACAWCAVAHTVNLLTLLGIQRLYRRGRAVRAVRASEAELSSGSAAVSGGGVPGRRQAVHAAAFALIIIAGLWFYRHEALAMGTRLRALRPYQELVSSLRNDPDFLLREHYAQPQQSIRRRDGHAADDLPPLVVFTDFECSVCYCAEQRLRRQALPAFDGQLTITVRHFPLNEECNAAASGAKHPNACEAAYAAEAARLQGGEQAFGRMHQLLFANQDRLGPALYRELAEHIGLDGDRFRRDLGGDTVRRIVREDVSLAKELGVRGTPTTFFEGRRISAFGRDNPVFWQALAGNRPPACGADMRASADP